MRFDIDLARQILQIVEDDPEADGGSWVEVSVPGRSDREVSYHVRLLDEEGLLVAKDNSTLDGPCFQPMRLTKPGHDFLTAARNDTLWNKAKAYIAEKGSALTIEAMKVALGIVVRAQLAG